MQSKIVRERFNVLTGKSTKIESIGLSILWPLTVGVVYDRQEELHQTQDGEETEPSRDDDVMHLLKLISQSISYLFRASALPGASKPSDAVENGSGNLCLAEGLRKSTDDMVKRFVKLDDSIAARLSNAISARRQFIKDRQNNRDNPFRLTDLADTVDTCISTNQVPVSQNVA